MTFHPDQLPDLTGKVYIVTGGTGGLGYYTVAQLAEHGAHVYLCARNESKALKAVSSLRALYPKARLSSLIMDHTRISTVIAAAKDFLSRETLLHGLVNNAGVLAVPLEMTGDGYDLTWQVNYLAHCVFTHQLLPLMLETSKGLPAGAVRVVNITSGGHLMAPKMGINFEDTSLRGFSTVNRYGQSKLANILHAKQLHKLHGPSPQRTRSVDGEIWTSAVHPGIVQSDLDDRAVEMPWYMRAASNIAQWTGGRWPTDKGAWTQVFCVASPDMEASQSGTLFERIAKPASMESSKAKNMELAAKLEDWTTKEMKKHGWA